MEIRVIPIMICALLACSDGEPANDARGASDEAVDMPDASAPDATDVTSTGVDATPPEPDAGGEAVDVPDASAPDATDAPGAAVDATIPEPDAGGAAEPGEPALGEPGYETLPALGLGVRQEHAVVALGGRVCVLGGFAPSITASAECYDPNSGGWQPIASFPRSLHHAHVAVVDGKLYVLGYLYNFAFAATGASHVYDPEQDAWSDLAPMPQGRERGSGATVVVGRDVYVIGGARGSALAEVDIYDTVADAWRVGPSLPAPREHLCAGAVGDLIVVASGRAGGITGHTDSTLVLEPGASSWREGAPMPTARGGAACAVLAGRLHVFGGEGNPDASTGVFSEAEAYDPISDSWATLPPMPVPRHGFGAATLDGRLYLPGGATEQAFGAVADVEVFFYR